MTLINTLDNAKKYLDEKGNVVGIYLDLTKAFDTVQHTILLDKLYHYGVRGVANIWLDSYLSGRKQLVSVNECDSEMQSVTTGVPQGSVLRPLLLSYWMKI